MPHGVEKDKAGPSLQFYLSTLFYQLLFCPHPSCAHPFRAFTTALCHTVPRSTTLCSLPRLPFVEPPKVRVSPCGASTAPHIIIQLYANRILEFRADLAAHLGADLAVGLSANLAVRLSVQLAYLAVNLAQFLMQYLAQFLERGRWSGFGVD